MGFHAELRIVGGRGDVHHLLSELGRRGMQSAHAMEGPQAEQHREDRRRIAQRAADLTGA